MSYLLDRLLRRCHQCGEWAYGRQPCAVCDTPARAEAAPRRPRTVPIPGENGRRSA